MGHLVTDAVGAPAEPQLGQIAGADHHAAMAVGQAEEVVGPQARLHVLEGDVVDLFAPREGMVHVGQHLPGGGTDVDLLAGDAQRLHQGPGVGLGGAGGGEARQGIGQHIGPRQAQPVHGPHRHDQGMGGIQPSRDPDHRPFHAGGLKPLGQALDLDVVGLVAVLAQPRGIGRHVGEALDRPLQRHRLGRSVQGEVHDAEARDAVGFLPRAVAEAVQPHALLADAAEVHVGEHHLVAGEAPGLGQGFAQLEHARLAVPGEVGGGFARAGGGVEIGGHRRARLAGAEQPAGLGLADGDVAGGEVQ